MNTYTDTPNWLIAPPPKLNHIQKQWLFRPGALTSGLRQLGNVEIKILKECIQSLPFDEASTCRQYISNPVWVREILMSINGIPAVAARSLTPLKASHGVWQGIRKLTTRPLADILYNDRAISRSNFECGLVKRSMPIYHTLAQVLRPVPVKPTLARRSTFWKDEQPLLVTECFLPAFWNEIIPGASQKKKQNVA